MYNELSRVSFQFITLHDYHFDQDYHKQSRFQDLKFLLHPAF